MYSYFLDIIVCDDLHDVNKDVLNLNLTYQLGETYRVYVDGCRSRGGEGSTVLSQAQAVGAVR